MLHKVGLLLVLFTLSSCVVRKTNTIKPEYTVVMQEQQLSLREDFLKNAGDKVLFSYDSAVLTSEARDTLKKQASWLVSHPEAMATIEGYCDIRGKTAYNLTLGAKRARAVEEYLLEQGVASSRLRVISHGKDHLTHSQLSREEALDLERRVVTDVTIKAIQY